MDDFLDRIRKRYESAKREHDLFRRLWEDAYQYALPARTKFTGSTQGENRAADIFDATAVVSLHEFASRLQSGLTPTFSRWTRLRPGQDIPEAQRDDIDKQLDGITEEVFAVLHRSNFDSQAHEAYMELGVGTGTLLADEDPDDFIRFQAVPLTQLMLDRGAGGTIDGRFRRRDMTARELKGEYPKATLPQNVEQCFAQNRDDKFEVRDATFKVNPQARFEEKYRYLCWLENPKTILADEEYEGPGSCPWINFRWSVAAGETYGRGPLLNCLPDIKVANALVQFTLMNAEMATVGLWQAADDGVITPSLIRLTPGAIIPKAPGSMGLQPLAPAARFDVANLILGDLRNNIKTALYHDTLGPPTGTPMSATEVSERMQDLYRRMGSAYGRLQRELVQPVVRRVLYILRKKGRIKVPSLNGRVIEIRAESPLSSAQNQQDVMRFQGFASTLAQTFGPQQVIAVLNGARTAQWLRSQYGLDASLVNNEEEMQQVLAMMANAAQTQMQ